MNSALSRLYDDDLEAELLGALLTDPSQLPAVARVLKSSDLHDISARAAYDSIQRLGPAANFVTVTADLQKRGQLSRIGGAGYLAWFTVAAAEAWSLDCAEATAKKLADLARRRHLIGMLERTAQGVLDLKKPLEVTMREMAPAR